MDRILLYLLALDNTPTGDVPPDPRLSIRGIAEGTQIPATKVLSQLEKLVDEALVRPIPTAFDFIYVLTAKGRNYIKIQVGKREQKKWFRFKLGAKGPKLEFGSSETKKTS